MAWDTAGRIISDAALELGLGAVADPYTSLDPNVQQLCGFLKSCGRSLVRVRDWTHIQREATFPTVAAQEEYSLPADFLRMIDQTGWNRTSGFPLGGPLSPQRWQYLAAQPGASFPLVVLFRPAAGVLRIFNPPSAPATIAYEYISSAWVQPADVEGVTPDPTDAPAAASDVVLFDPLLMMRAVKLAFLRAKGFDTVSAQQEFEETLELASAGDAPSAVHRLDRSPCGEPLIDVTNLPITGYGQP